MVIPFRFCKSFASLDYIIIIPHFYGFVKRFLKSFSKIFSSYRRPLFVNDYFVRYCCLALLTTILLYHTLLQIAIVKLHKFSYNKLKQFVQNDGRPGDPAPAVTPKGDRRHWGHASNTPQRFGSQSPHPPSQCDFPQKWCHW